MKDSKIDRIIIKHLVGNKYGDDEKLYKIIKSIISDVIEIDDKEVLKKEKNKKILHHIDKIKENLKSIRNEHEDDYNKGFNSGIKYCLKILDFATDEIKRENKN